MDNTVPLPTYETKQLDTKDEIREHDQSALYLDPNELDNSENFTCHQNYSTHTSFVVGIKFWLEGVVLSVTGAFGMIGNLITLKVLKKQVIKYIK